MDKMDEILAVLKDLAADVKAVQIVVQRKEDERQKAIAKVEEFMRQPIGEAKAATGS